MENFVTTYDKFINAITKVVGCIAGLLVMICGFSIAYEVVCRGVFNAPTEWVMEISTYCVVIAGFLGMGVAYAGGKHIHVDILLSHLSKKQRTYIEVLTTIAGIFYSFVFTMQAIGMVQMSFEVGITAPTTLGTPMWIPQSSMPIGFAVLCLQLIGTLMKDIIKIKNQDFEEEK